MAVAGLSLITGATGFAGGHLVERLAGQGTDVHAWAHNALPDRSSDSSTDARSAKVEGATGKVIWAAVDMLVDLTANNWPPDVRRLAVMHSDPTKIDDPLRKEVQGLLASDFTAKSTAQISG